MPEIRDIIRRIRAGQSLRSIGKELHIHRKTIRKARQIAMREGWLDSERALPGEAEIAAIWKVDVDKAAHPLDIWKSKIERWVKEGISCLLIHEFVQEIFPCSYSTVNRYLRKTFPQKPKPAVIRRQPIVGEIMEVDFGELGTVYDAKENRNRKCWVFSARLMYSRKAYRAICFDQKQDTFFLCHIHAFEYFGGVPLKVVPDNLKAAVIKAAFDDPLINKSYRALAEHYGFMISPTLPYHPHHKGGVENDIKYIKGNFWPRFKEKQLQLGHDIPFSNNIQQELEHWVQHIADKRKIGGVGQTPDELFSEEEGALKPLPVFRWEPVEWVSRKVGEDWHVQLRKAFYSAPCELIGKTVEVCVGRDFVRIFRDYKQVAEHPKAKKLWLRLAKSVHAPPNYHKALDFNQKGMLLKAGSIGQYTRIVCTMIFSNRSTDGLRPVRAMLGFAKTYDAVRLEKACARAVEYRTTQSNFGT